MYTYTQLKYLYTYKTHTKIHAYLLTHMFKHVNLIHNYVVTYTHV